MDLSCLEFCVHLVQEREFLFGCYVLETSACAKEMKVYLMLQVVVLLLL